MNDLVKSRTLGRGLASLLGVDSDMPILNGELLNVSVEVLTPGKYQPRLDFDDVAMASLVASIKEKGVLQPILVRPTQHRTATYEIIAGERRWQASKLAGLESVPVIVRPMNDQNALEAALIENIQRDDLTPLEEAEAYKRLMDEFAHTQEGLANAIGKSRSHLANMLRLLSLPDLIKNYLHEGLISAGHARALIGCDNANLLAEKIIKDGLSVRQTEKLVQNQGGKHPSPSQSKSKDSVYDEDCSIIEKNIEEAIGVKASLTIGKNQYKLNLVFENMEDLDRIVSKICQK
jgi:ParB family chromosome partitioning protein